MPRSGSGSYTLPSGNPVVSGTTIEANWANNTLNDVATTLTDSLSRSGQGGMTAAFRAADGSASVPGVAWSSETGTGFYRAGAGDTRFVVTTTEVQKWLSTGTAITGTLSATGDAGVGTAPSAWGGAGRGAIDLGTGGAVMASTSIGTSTSYNAYYNGTNWLYKISSTGATRYTSTSVGHEWFVAPSGTAGNAISFTQSMTLDSSGNLGLGVTPSAWATNWSAVQVGQGNTALVGRSDAFALYLGQNWRYDGADKYIGSSAASVYTQQSGQHIWFTAPSGTAGDAISFTQSMTLDASGKLFVATTTDNANARVHFAGTTQANNGINLSYGGVGSALIRIADGNALTFGLDTSAGNTERARITSEGDFIPILQGTAPTLTTNGQMVFTLTSDTNLRISVRGSDGVTRTTNLTLA